MQLYDDGDIESSLMAYTFLAELGMEVAQSNVAFLLEQGFLPLVQLKHIDYTSSLQMILTLSIKMKL